MYQHCRVRGERERREKRGREGDKASGREERKGCYTILVSYNR